MDRDIWREIFEIELEDREIFHVWNFSVDEYYQEREGWPRYAICCCASFYCSICGRYWTSSKVHILFQMKMKRQTGQVRMHVFKQKCKMCTNAGYEEPVFQEENIEIAIGDLVNKILQKFYNMAFDDLPRSFVKDGRQNGPHDFNNCEGCALGICKCYTYTEYYDKRPILPKKSNKRSKAKKKRFPPSDMFSYHQVPVQSQGPAYQPREAAAVGGSSHCSVNIPCDEQSGPSESCPCIIL